MITEKVAFSILNGNNCYGKRILHRNQAGYCSKLSLKNGVQQIKATQEKMWQRCIFLNIAEGLDHRNRIKIKKKNTMLDFYFHFLYI